MTSSGGGPDGLGNSVFIHSSTTWRGVFLQSCRPLHCHQLWESYSGDCWISLSTVFCQCSGRQTHTNGKALISPSARGEEGARRCED